MQRYKSRHRRGGCANADHITGSYKYEKNMKTEYDKDLDYTARGVSRIKFTLWDTDGKTPIYRCINGSFHCDIGMAWIELEGTNDKQEHSVAVALIIDKEEDEIVVSISKGDFDNVIHKSCVKLELSE